MYMKDKHKKYLDKVVEFLIRDTTIDFNSRKISYPFLPLSHPLPPLTIPFLLFSPLLPPTISSPRPFLFHFSTYVRDVYGLTENEKEYVWDEYKKNIKDKIENER